MDPHGHGHSNIDPESYERRMNRSVLQKYLNLFPARARVGVGTVTLLSSAYLLYLFVRPSPKNRPVHTLTPEWEAATEAYREAQNINPIRRYKEAGK